MGTEIKNNPSETKDEIMRKKEQKLYENEFIKTWDIEKFPNGHISLIQDNVYWVFLDKNKLSYYLDESWKVIFNISGIRELEYVKEATLWSWYFEKKEWELYNLYEVLWLDKADKPILTKTPIDPYSKKYYEAWVNIRFNRHIIDKSTLKKNPTEWFSKEELKAIEKDIDVEIWTGAVTIDDLEVFLDQKKITKDFFDKAIKRVIEEKLLLQCSDERLDEVKQWITVKKLKKYYEKWYISVEIAENCRLAIEAKEKKAKKENRIWNDTWKKIENLK